MPTLSLSYIKEKWQHAGFQKYFQNMSWMFISRIFVLIIAFLINIYMARYLGPGNYGLLNYVISFVGLFSFIASLGIENITNREVINNPENKDKIIGTSFYLKLAGSLTAILIIFTSAKLTTNNPMLLGLIWMYSITYIFTTFNIIDVFFQSQALSKYPSIVMIIVGVISAFLKIGVMFFHYGIIWITAIYVFESILTALGLLYFFILKGNSVKKWTFDKKVATMILRDSWPLMLTAVAIGIYMKIDQVMIKNMLGNESAGIYAAAVKLSEFWYFVPSLICVSIFPAIVNAKKVSGELYNNRLIKLYSIMFWLSFFIAIVTTIFAYLIVHTLFGSQYLGAVATLKIYVWAGIAVSLSAGLSQYLIAENYTKISAISTAVGAILNIILNIILIPLYGIEGAAFATLISYSASVTAVLIFQKNHSQIKNIYKAILVKKS
jgi:O-antigen/teichoic acid export membrane protein